MLNSQVLRFLALIVTACVQLITPANAGPTPPEGWSIQIRDRLAVMVSPPDDAGDQIVYFMDPVEPLDRRPSVNDQRFTALTRDHAGRLGELSWQQGITREGTLLKDAVTITGEDGTKIHGLSFAYPTPQGLQLLSVYWPAPLTSDDPRVAAALDHIANLWRSSASFDGQDLHGRDIHGQDFHGRDMSAAPPVTAPAPAIASMEFHPDPNTWGSWQTEKALTLIHPCTPDGIQVALTLMPAWSIGTDSLESWFNTQINSLIQGWTNSGLRPSPAQSVDGATRTATYAFKNGDGSYWKAWFRAVQRGDRVQMAAVIAPAVLGLSDTRVAAALNHVRTLYLQGYTLLPEQIQYPRNNSLDFNNTGTTVTGVLTTSNVLQIGTGRFDSATQTYTLLSNGRAFKTSGGVIEESSPRGTWQKTPSGYVLDWPDQAIREKVAPACFSSAVPASTPPRPEPNGCVLMPFTITYPNGGQLTLWNKHCG